MENTNIIKIENLDDTRLDIYARLNEAQLYRYNEPADGIFVAESPNVIERALDFGCKPISMLVESKYIEGRAANVISRCGDIPIMHATADVLIGITGFNLTRGMLCAMKRPILPSMEDILRDARRIVILEDVVNPTNVGAIFRSAAALGMDGVLLTPPCSDPLYRRATRVSMGTVFQIPWTYIKNDKSSLWPQPTMDLLHDFGFKTAAMALSDNSVSVDDPTVCAEDKLAIIMGTEGDGLKDTTIKGCDYTVKIPMAPGVDSLNVAAASAVAFWQMR